MSVAVTITLNGARVPVELDDSALAAIAAATTSNGTAPAGLVAPSETENS